MFCSPLQLHAVARSLPPYQKATTDQVSLTQPAYCCAAAPVLRLCCCHCMQPIARFSLPTANSVLMSALEWGEVMVVKDTVTYFGRNAGGGAVKDLFLPDRPMVGTPLGL